MSEKKIDLIAQLLAKAESTTAEEAEALTEHAARLMKKYMIDQAVIDEKRAKAGQSHEKIVEERLDFTGAYRGEMLHLCSQVARGLGALRGMQYTGGKGKVFSFWLVGFESDVAQAKILIASLQVQAAVAVREWWKLHKVEYAGLNTYEQEKARRSFVHGFGTGAGARLQASRNAVMESVTKTTDLVLVSRDERVQAYMDALSTRKGRARTATGRDRAAGHGYEAGQNASVGEKAVSRGRGITA